MFRWMFNGLSGGRIGFCLKMIFMTFFHFGLTTDVLGLNFVQ